MSDLHADTPKPIRRHAGLVPLSRDHHFGLLLVWKIRKGISLELSPTRIRDYVHFYFEQDLAPHFAVEEMQVFTLLPEDDTLRLRAEEEHALMRNMLAQSTSVVDYQWLHAFADTLEQHIRFEERILFNHLQESVDPDALPVEEQEHPRQDPDVQWQDHFWVSDIYHPAQRK